MRELICDLLYAWADAIQNGERDGEGGQCDDCVQVLLTNCVSMCLYVAWTVPNRNTGAIVYDVTVI